MADNDVGYEAGTTKHIEADGISAQLTQVVSAQALTDEEWAKLIENLAGRIADEELRLGPDSGYLGLERDRHPVGAEAISEVLPPNATGLPIRALPRLPSEPSSG